MNYASAPLPVPFWKRWINRLMPYNPCDFQDLPKQVKMHDGLVVKTRVELSFKDRLIVLFTGKLEVESNTSTENVIGFHRTNSTVRLRFTKD